MAKAEETTTTAYQLTLSEDEANYLASLIWKGVCLEGENNKLADDILNALLNAGADEFAFDFESADDGLSVLE